MQRTIIVTKEVKEERSYSAIEKLTPKERVDEIARMLGGEDEEGESMPRPCSRSLPEAINSRRILSDF